MTEIAQNQGFVEIERLRGLLKRTEGRYVAIVARQRSRSSLVQALYDVGWSGIYVTSEAGRHASLLADHHRDHDSHAALMPGATGTGQSKGGAGNGAGANGREDGFPAALTLTLADLRGSGPGGDVHLLIVEADAAAMATFDAEDFRAFRPWVVLVDLPTREDDRSRGSWRTRLEQAGYDEISGDGPALWFRARECGDLAFGPSRPGNARCGRDPTDRTTSTPSGVAADDEATLQALARTREDLDGLQARYAQEVRLHGALIERLRGELRDAQGRAASLEALQADSLRLARISALLDGKMSSAIQNCGLDTFRHGLAGQVGNWMAEVERDRADLLLRLETETHQRRAVLGSTSWRLTGPLRRLGRASRVALHQPRRLPMLLIRRLRRAAHLASSDVSGAPAVPPPAEGRSDGLAEAAARIDGELIEVSELLQRLAAVAAGRDDGHHASAPPPSSAAYRAMTHAGRLAAWIRHDAARQRAEAP